MSTENTLTIKIDDSSPMGFTGPPIPPSMMASTAMINGQRVDMATVQTIQQQMERERVRAEHARVRELMEGRNKEIHAAATPPPLPPRSMHRPNAIDGPGDGWGGKYTGFYASQGDAGGGAQAGMQLASMLGGQGGQIAGLLSEGGNAALGPLAGVAAGAIAAKMAMDKLTAGMNASAQRIEENGRIAADQFGNNYWSAWRRNNEGVISTMEEIPVVGGLMAAQLRMTVAPLKAFGEVVQAVNDRGRELAQYSARLAGTAANNDVRNLRADLREADVLGDEMAAVMDSTNRVENTIRELALPIKEAVLKQIAPMLERIANGIELVVAIRDSLPVFLEAVKSAIESALSGEIRTARDKVAKGLDDIKKLLEEDDSDNDQFYNMVMDAARSSVR